MSTVGTAAIATNKQTVKTLITNALSQYFGSTLNREQDIVNIVMAMVQQESAFSVVAVGPVISTSVSSGAKDYWTSQPIQNLLATGTPTQRSLASQGLQAWGLLQSMGWNHIKGASKKNGQTEIEQSRPDLAGQLVWAPGTDLSTKLYTTACMPTQILAGLVLLESKYKYVTQTTQGWHYGKSSQYFSSKLSAAIGAYLGLGGYDRATGMTPSQYVANIVYGRMYQLANNSSTNGVSGTQTLNIASGNNQYPPGC